MMNILSPLCLILYVCLSLSVFLSQESFFSATILLNTSDDSLTIERHVSDSFSPHAVCKQTLSGVNGSLFACSFLTDTHCSCCHFFKL